MALDTSAAAALEPERVDRLPDLKRMVENASSMTEEARRESERARDYYDGYQFTEDEEAELRRRGQPIVPKNRIRRKIDAMRGIEQRGRTDPTARPRAPGDEDAADVATKVLQFVEETEEVDQKSSDSFENLLVEGVGGVEVCAEKDKGQWEVRVKHLRWEEIIFDPYSRERDFSDAAYLGVLKWMSVERAQEFLRPFDVEAGSLALDLGTTNAGIGDTYDDRPASGAFTWADKKQRRVRIAQLYYREAGTWRLAIFTGREAVYDEVSPYLGNDGRPACAILLMSAYVDRENRRYGMVRDLIPAQDEVNKRLSKLLHMLNSRQTLSVAGAVDSVVDLKRELAKPDGHVQISTESFEDAARVGMKPFDIIPQGDQVQGHFALLQEAKAEIDMLGPNASLLGQLGASASGRAIMAQQQAGLAELAPIYDSLAHWKRRLYRQIWAAIRQFWTAPRYVRVTEDNEAPKFLGLNQPTQQPDGSVVTMNPVGEINVDITIDQSPEYVSLEAEQFEALVRLAEARIAIPPEAIIEASSLRGKKKLLEQMKAPQAPPEVMQMQQQLAQRGAVAQVAELEAKVKRLEAAAMKDMATVPKLQAETAHEAAEAQTAGMEARQAAHGAQVMQAQAVTAGAQALSAQTVAQAQAVMARRAAGF